MIGLDLITKREIFDLAWKAIISVFNSFQWLEQKGVDRIYILGGVLLGLLVIDSALLWALNWLWWLLGAGVVSIAANGVLQFTSGSTTALNNAGENIIRSLEGVTNGQPARIEAAADAPPGHTEGEEASRTKVFAERGAFP